MIEVQEINDIDELAGYRLAWNSWLANSPRATFVNTFDWLENYWQHFGRRSAAPRARGPLGGHADRHSAAVRAHANGTA